MQLKRSYHQQEFSNSQDNYYSEGQRIRGKWHGRLAGGWGLKGEVQEEHFARLADGQHPLTGEQLVQPRSAYEYLNRQGETIHTMEHRAGWDATFSAPKSVSLTALVGATSACGWRIGKPSMLLSTSWRNIFRRALVATIRQKLPANGWLRDLSMTAAGR